jgi:hypothetical protein
MGRLLWFLFFRAWKQYLERYYFLVWLFLFTLLGLSIETQLKRWPGIDSTSPR